MGNQIVFMRYICNNCGYIGLPIYNRRGSFAVELLLWLFFLLPGFIYTLWRSSERYATCPKCQAVNMIPGDTPKGRELLQKRGIETTIAFEKKKTRYWIFIVVMAILIALLYLYTYVLM